MRGEFKEEYKKYGIENTVELRLLQYLQYCALNNERPLNVNDEEILTHMNTKDSLSLLSPKKQNYALNFSYSKKIIAITFLKKQI